MNIHANMTVRLRSRSCVILLLPVMDIHTKGVRYNTGSIQAYNTSPVTNEVLDAQKLYTNSCAAYTKLINSRRIQLGESLIKECYIFILSPKELVYKDSEYH